jgi:hypothetical protein
MPLARERRTFGKSGIKLQAAFEHRHIGGFVRRCALSWSIRPPPHRTGLLQAILRARPGIDRNFDVTDARYRGISSWMSN